MRNNETGKGLAGAPAAGIHGGTVSRSPFAFALLGGLLAWPGARSHAQTCTIDAGADLQTIDGFGFCTTWSPVMSSDQAAQLFGTGPGQFGFNLLRVYIDENGNFGDDIANAAIGHAWGATVLGTAWTPPPAMKTSASSVAGTLLPSQYAAYAAYLAHAAGSIGLDYVSFQNEPDISVTYQSCFWTPAQMQTFTAGYAAAIGRPLVMPESYHFDDAFADATLNDPAGVGQIAFVGGHIYGGGNAVHANALAHGKHVWMTEHFNYGQDLPTALLDAKEVSDCLHNQFSAYIWWHAYHAELTTLDLMDGRTPLLNGSAIGQFSHWIRPGMIRCSSTYAPQAGVFVTAYHHPGLVIVALNLSNNPVQQAFSVQNAPISSLVPYQTGGPYRRQMAQLDPLTAQNNGFTFTLAPQSVTTFVSFDSAPPTLLAQPADAVVFPGAAFSLSVQAAGSANSYQWYKDGAALANQTQPVLAVANATPANAGSYSAVVTNAAGSATSRAAAVRVESDAARLINLSCQTQVAAGGLATVGFFIGGTGTKQVLIRAGGPALAAFGIPNAMPDPQIKLYQGATVLAQNSQWSPAAVGATFTQVGAFPFSAGSHDAALIATLPAGHGYSVQASSLAGAGGAVLVEIYDADPAGTASELINLSARGLVGAAANGTLTAGFVLSGTGSRNLLVRAAGPALLPFGVADALPDPQLMLFDQAALPLLSNAGWTTAASVSSLLAATSAVSAFPFAAASRDSGAIVLLAPSLYTIQISSAAHTAGEALAEIYQAP